MSKWKILLSDYGIIFILLGLVIFFSLLTIEKQDLTGTEAGTQLAAQVSETRNEGDILLIGSESLDDQDLTSSFLTNLNNNYTIKSVTDGPPATRKAIEESIKSGQIPAVIATSTRASRWLLFQNFNEHFPQLTNTIIVSPQATTGSNFLKRENLLNVADQIAVIAIMAIGMTMVIITGGIDLSVGSLVALSAVLITQLIKTYFGAEAASDLDMIVAGILTILICGSIGFISGILSTAFKIPSFIVTLSMMLIGSGLAYTISEGQSIYQVPDNFIWLGRGRLLGIPVSVLIMVVLYVGANIIMSKMVFGRYVYAIGGNKVAARLSGVPINKIVTIVFTISGVLAGVGGIILASQLNSGSPTYGVTYELYVIAAVVVGGTSLMGGEGKIWGTLIGAFIIGVIQNGMNLIGIESYTQKVILGILILIALLVEKMRKGS